MLAATCHLHIFISRVITSFITGPSGRPSYPLLPSSTLIDLNGIIV